jgi:Family of unknown function (DUF6194)
MDEASITQYITDTFVAVDVVVASGDTFFFYNPGHNLPPERKFPFTTLVTSDNDGSGSDLNRPSVFRLNIGVSKDTFRSLFGLRAAPSDAGGAADSGYDFTALDQLMPHPLYGSMYWICVLNPRIETFQTVKPLLAEAYELSARKYSKARPASES